MKLDPTVDRCIPILMRLTRSRNSYKWVTKVYQRHLYFNIILTKMKDLKTRKFILEGLCAGLSITVILLGIKTYNQSREIEELKSGMSDLNKTCDTKNMIIGKIMTELKIKGKKK